MNTALFTAILGGLGQVNTLLSSVVTVIGNKASTAEIDALLTEIIAERARMRQLLDFVGGKIGLPAPTQNPPAPTV
jgi:hypothetical protein